MEDRLVALDGSPDVSLQAALVVIGRHPSCDVCIDSVRISRVHCCIYRDGRKVFVRDLNSTNGLRINGIQITSQAELREGDVLSIANLRYRRQAVPASAGGIKSNDSCLGESSKLRRDMNTPIAADMAPELVADIDLASVRNAVRQAIPGHLAGQYCVEVNLRPQKPLESQSSSLGDLGSPE